MSLTSATLFIAIATTVLAVGSGITAGYAVRTFKKSDAVKGGRKMLEKQNEMLEVQSGRLEICRELVDDQHEINETYGKVLDLQTREIRASLEERKQSAEEDRRSQAAKVTTWLAPSDNAGTWEARVRNAFDLPIYDVWMSQRMPRKCSVTSPTVPTLQASSSRTLPEIAGNETRATLLTRTETHLESVYTTLVSVQ
jgi:hypothetical protein